MALFIFDAAQAHTIHLILEWLAIAVGVQIYRRQKRLSALQSPTTESGQILADGNFAIVLGCILGAAIGNKLVFWIEVPHLWSSVNHNINTLLSGQSIVGGLLGGLLGVEIAKKITHQTQSTGDLFILPLIVATIIGRIGCFLAGLNDGTFGNPTQLPWGIDFGDGITRHPTQLYDMLFVLIWGGLIISLKMKLRHKAGLSFKLYLSGYLCWRLVIDSIKPVPYEYFYHLSGIQVVCVAALIIYIPLTIAQLISQDSLT